MPRLLLVFGVMFAACPVLQAGEMVFLHVSPDGDDHWSGHARTPNSTRTDGPLATLAGARDSIRNLPSPHPPVTVLIAAGTYPLTQPFTLEPVDSGRPDAPVLYEAGDENIRPHISGGRRISGWTIEKDGTWITHIPDVATGKWWFEQLWINGRRATRARTPDTGFDRLIDVSEAPFDTSEEPVKSGEKRVLKHARQTLRIDPALISRLPTGDAAALRDVQIIIFHKWDVTRRFLTGIDPVTSSIEITGPGMQPWNRLGKDSRFYLENYPAALDAPGEWFLSRDGTLRYRPLSGEDCLSVEAIAPVAEQLLVLHGDPSAGRFVEHVTFKDLVFEHAGRVTPAGGLGPAQAAVDLDAAILADGARHVRIENCEVAHADAYALWMRRGCQAATVNHCYLHDLGGGGIRIGETRIPPAPADRTGGITVDNTIIRDDGRTYAAAVGIWIGQSSDNHITHNSLSYLTYTGISLGWTWGYGASAATGNLIARNDIHHIGDGRLSDLGGIYTLGISPGTVLSGNVIHDIDRADYGGWGIYFDEGSTDILAENNLVYRARSGGFHQHYGRENRVRNNIFAFGSDAELRCTRAEPHLSFTFERNILYWADGPLVGGNWAKANLKLGHNVYYNTHGQPVDFSGKTLSELQQAGQDEGSMSVDPLFRNPTDGDFTLSPKSPALKLGFVPLEPETAGVYGDRAWLKLAGDR
ncbi:MAG TPA: right-handed parallel beta-helix repeat-containing protein [Rariglobus sp.]|nr:right-handed parallel beta-helix repeat-containing protein [Rariglobus sp.]